jgi:DNA polymerase-3 subunit epsilon
MMREIVFDTETTGVDPDKGDRVVEIGMVELIDLVPSGRTFHRYINPMRDVPPEVVRVHGLTNAFLDAYPPFEDDTIARELLAFIGDAPLVAHNAEFDRRFLNAELARIAAPPIAFERCVDTLIIARKTYPGAPNSLDALCRRLNIDLSKRDKHGALLDAQLLAAVYLELRGGRERRLSFLDPAAPEAEAAGGLLEAAGHAVKARAPRPAPLAPLSTEEERAAHAAFLAGLPKAALWTVAEPPAA